jgi:hypothetical protein
MKSSGVADYVSLLFGIASAFLGLGLAIVFAYCAFAFLALRGGGPTGLLGLARPPYLWIFLAAGGLVAALGWAGRRVARRGRSALGRTSVAASGDRGSALGLAIGLLVAGSTLLLFLARLR